MNIYKATFKEKTKESYWDNKPLLIVAASFSNAEDKAKNYYSDRELLQITLYGETTKNKDVYQLRDR